jgi:hypothetical protein
MGHPTRQPRRERTWFAAADQLEQNGVILSVSLMAPAFSTLTTDGSAVPPPFNSTICHSRALERTSARVEEQCGYLTTCRSLLRHYPPHSLSSPPASAA